MAVLHSFIFCLCSEKYSECIQHIYMFCNLEYIQDNSMKNKKYNNQFILLFNYFLFSSYQLYKKNSYKHSINFILRSIHNARKCPYEKIIQPTREAQRARAGGGLFTDLTIYLYGWTSADLSKIPPFLGGIVVCFCR